MIFNAVTAGCCTTQSQMQERPYFCYLSNVVFLSVINNVLQIDEAMRSTQCYKRTQGTELLISSLSNRRLGSNQEVNGPHSRTRSDRGDISVI